MSHDPALNRFAEETEPELESVQRVRARLAGSLQEAPRSTSLGPLLGGLALGAGAMALLLMFLLPSTDPAFDLELSAEAGASTVSPVEGLDLRFEGHGMLTGSPSQPRIVWQAGTLHVDVDPAAGRAVSVTTGEASVAVVGTAFEVRRSALGTRVTVEHGTVSVRCKRGAAGELSDGATSFCLPASAAGMLARARVLQDQSNPPADVLKAADDGLGRDPAAAVREELRIVRIEALRDAGRVDEALTEARALVSTADHRAAQVQELITALERAAAP